MTALTTGGHTIGASAGLFSIEAIGTVAPSATTFEPDIWALWRAGKPIEAWNGGLQRMFLAENFQGSRFVIYNDHYADAICNAKPKAMIKNGYDDINKANLGFIDGHVKYVTCIPGNTRESYTNDQCTMIFDDLKVYNK